MAAVERLYSAKLFRSTNYTVRIVSFSHSYSLPSLVFITPMSTVDQTRHLQQLSDVDEKPYLFTKPGGDVTHAARTTSGFTRVGWMTVTGSYVGKNPIFRRNNLMLTSQLDDYVLDLWVCPHTLRVHDMYPIDQFVTQISLCIWGVSRFYPV